MFIENVQLLHMNKKAEFSPLGKLPGYCRVVFSFIEIFAKGFAILAGGHFFPGFKITF